MGGRLVGRVNEVRAVRDALRDGRPVAILGPGGIGKTALARAALRDAPHLEGGALPSFSHQPYFALSRALSRRLDGDAEAVAATVLDALGSGTLFVDDLHWADHQTIELLTELIALVPVVVTARADELTPEGKALVANIPIVEVPPLTRRAADTLTERLRPDLGPSERNAIVRIAAGNPLLLEALADSGELSPSLLATVAAQLDALPPEARHTLARLAILDRAAPITGELDERIAAFVVNGPEGTSVRHPLLAAAIVDALSGAERRRVHAELAVELDGTEAIRHALEAGAHEQARAMVEDALAGDECGPAERAELVRLLAVASDGPESVDAWLAAAAALVDVGRWAESIAASERAVAMSAERAADGLLLLGRARWFIGDVDGAEDAFARAIEASKDERVNLRVLLEQAYLRVRDRRPEALAVARDAFDLAERVGAEQARAASMLGAALLYDGAHGWRELLEQAIDGALLAGDDELAATAGYHLASGLGFTGNLRLAADISRERASEARRAGLDTWAVHFEAVDLYNRVLMGVEMGATADECRAFLVTNPVFRNRFEIELGLVLSLLDRADLEGARRESDRARDHAARAEGRAFALVGAAEVGWCAGDADACEAAALQLRELGDVWFGIRINAEVAAAHACAEAGRVFETSVPTTVLPVLWPALHEIDGWRAWASGDTERALEAFDRAVEAWTRHEFPRFTIRAHHASWLVARSAGRRDARARPDAAIALARDCGMLAYLERFGEHESDLTPRESEVLRLVGLGLTSAAIAEMLGISAATVDQHVLRARLKLGASSRLEAAHRGAAAR